jgi:uncharacterized membrane protein YjgN (DUF898 family)
MQQQNPVPGSYPPYASPGRPGFMPVDTSSGGMSVFIFGILGVVLCQLCAPVAWVNGNTYLRTCAAAGVRPNGIGVAGRVLGIIGTVLMVVTIVGVIVMLVAAG